MHLHNLIPGTSDHLPAGHLKQSVAFVLPAMRIDKEIKYKRIINDE
jgi:hypothetical protein